MIVLPTVNPIAFQIGPFEVRWYACAYVLGLLLGIYYIYHLEKSLKLFTGKDLKKKFLEDYFFYLAVSIILGGRLGYVIFYNLSYYLKHPLQTLYIWNGGMSFHGALIGCVLGIYLLAKRKNINPLTLVDLTVTAAPIGLFLGRIANFINQELIGRPSDLPWAVMFNDQFIARHPSQIYEALLEGVMLFIVLSIAWWKYKSYKTPGLNGSLFMILYGTFRFFIEFFRQPDAQIGYIAQYFTLGQIFCVLMVMVGLVVNRHLLSNSKNN